MASVSFFFHALCRHNLVTKGVDKYESFALALSQMKLQGVVVSVILLCPPLLSLLKPVILHNASLFLAFDHSYELAAASILALSNECVL